MGLKRQSNFARRRARPVAAVGGILWAFAAAALGLLFVALGDVATLRDQIAQTRDHADRLGDQVTELSEKAATAPDVIALRGQSERVSFFNGLTGPRQMPLTGVLALLERTLPQGVWINQLTYNEETGQLSLSLRTDAETELPVALRTLESDDALRNVILERQLRLTQGGRQLAQYDIEARVR